MEEHVDDGVLRVIEAVSRQEIECSVMFVADVAELESVIRELELEIGINSIRLNEWISRIPAQDREELEALLEAQSA